jgi:hypothetical protein
MHNARSISRALSPRRSKTPFLELISLPEDDSCRKRMQTERISSLVSAVPGGVHDRLIVTTLSAVFRYVP